MLQYNEPEIFESKIGGKPYLPDADFAQQDPRKSDEKLKSMTECLFKLDSNEDLDELKIGDSGILSVLISKEKLEKKKFDDYYIEISCF